MAATKLTLVAEANKGIGFETARQLARAGLTVLIGARDIGLGEAAAAKLRNEGLDVRAVELDVTRRETIAAAAARIDADFGGVHALVNNAAISAGLAEGPPSSADVDTARRVMETNFFGPLALTQAMPPLLRKAPAARIVSVSSGLGSLTIQADPDYAATDLNGHCGTQTVEEAAIAPVRLAQLGADGPSGGFFDAVEAAPW